MKKAISEVDITKNIENIIGYKFNDKELLKKAFIHNSYANENNIKKEDTYQRLEFLGDSVLSVIVSIKLYDVFKDADEGLLTRIRASIVCEQNLSSVARELNLYRFLYLGKGESKEKMKENNSVLCDTIEAVIGAIYEDGGFENAKQFIEKFIINDKAIKQLSKDTDKKDYKTKLQEKASKKGWKIEYDVVREKGPAHNKVYYIVCKIDGKIYSEGCGKNKKEAEQEAAKAAYKMKK